MSDVIGLFTREKLSSEDESVPEEMLDDLSADWMVCKKSMLRKLDDLKGMVQRNELREIVLVGRHYDTGYFLTEVMIPESHDRNDLYGLVGIMDALKAELSDSAMMAPFVKLNGEIIDPFEDEELE